MRYHELVEGRDAPLYRGFSELKYFAQAMRENRLVGSSSQRYWDDGRRRKDDEPDYRDSNWMKGLSFTRDKHFAMRWGGAVIAVDQSKIAQRNKIVPFNWGYSIANIPGDKPQHHKREREEFVITHKGGTYEDDTLGFLAPQGEIQNLSSFLLGIWLDIDVATQDYLQELLKEGGYPVEKVIRHPAFQGYYDYDPGTKKVRLFGPVTVTPIIHSREAA